MRQFVTHSGIAVPFLYDDINSDQIKPAYDQRSLHPDYGALWFARWRFDAAGNEIKDCVLNLPQFKSATILVAGRNFGCGSAREAAVWAMAAHNIQCIVARSFSEFFRANCVQNGILPVVLNDRAELFETLVQRADGTAAFTVDLRSETIVAPDEETFAFTMPPADRFMLLNGLDEIGMSLRHANAIDEWEARMRDDQPWLQRLGARS
jgi:3-isopropylmalate dehydratase small subunit